MGLHLAAVVFPTWQAVVLILLCFVSLLISLYCLLFMVPLKSFVARINLLGGGMKGIETHVDGIRSETERRMAALEKQIRDGMDQLRAEVQAATNATGDKAAHLQESIQKLERAAHNLQAEVRATASDTRKMEAALATFRAGMEEVQNDFSALEGELRSTVNQQVNVSYQKLESTVLSALQAVRDDMLRGASRLRTWQAPSPPPPPPSPQSSPAADGRTPSASRAARSSPRSLCSRMPRRGTAQRPRKNRKRLWTPRRKVRRQSDAPAAGAIVGSYCS